MKKVILIVFLLVHIIGCSYHHGQFPALIPNQVHLNGPNFKILKTVEGISFATYILGIGGFDRNGLVNEAKRDLYSKVKLGFNQTITNITIDYKYSFVFPILIIKKVIISADRVYQL